MGLCDDIGEVQLQMDETKEKIIEMIRRIIIMDMCYDGTLVMPSSYAVMEEDEMSYVEGGFYISHSKIASCYMAMASIYASAPHATTYAVNLVCKFVAKIWARFLSYVSSFISPGLGTILGYAVGLYTGVCAAWKFGTALVSGKGVEVSWNGLTVK